MDDETTFGEFVAARGPALLRLAWLLTGDPDAAQDLVQEALARSVRHWSRVSRRGNPEAYLRAAVRSVWVDQWRRRRGWSFSSGEVPDEPGPQDLGDDTARRLDLADALAELTPRQRAAVVLRFYEDLTEEETARALGCSPSTVKSTVRTALDRLRRRAPGLADWLVDPAPAMTVRGEGA